MGYFFPAAWLISSRYCTAFGLEIEYNTGGYIIPCFAGLIDGYAAKVKGLKPSKGTLNLDSFGHGYRTIWFG